MIRIIIILAGIWFVLMGAILIYHQVWIDYHCTEILGTQVCQ